MIGGVILPVSGVVPDSMMILVSGLGDRSQAQDQISVGMGTLAGMYPSFQLINWSASMAQSGFEKFINFIKQSESEKNVIW